MKKLLVSIVLLAAFAAASYGILTFYLVDNFEDGTFNKWFAFDNAKLSIFKNPKSDKKDLVLESCGENALKITGKAKNWYVGGMGTSVNIDPVNYSRVQFDLMGSPLLGKVKLELYQDSDKSGDIQQDANNGWKVTKDDIFAVEVPVLKDGYTRYSIPFTAFSIGNPGVGTGRLGDGPILRIQLIFIAPTQEGSVDCAVDNIIITN